MFTLTIETDNSAFGDDDPSVRAAELARILRKLADRIGETFGDDQGVVMDANGARVGTWAVSQ